MAYLIKWSTRYSLKIEEIDNQHIFFVDLINELYTSFLNKEQEDRMMDILHKMEEYATIHFGTEEKYFNQFNYPDTLAHIQEHQEFIRHLEYFRDEQKHSSGVLSYMILDYLREWFDHHILETDKKYEICFRINGLK
jgi:hemerythrin